MKIIPLNLASDWGEIIGLPIYDEHCRAVVIESKFEEEWNSIDDSSVIGMRIHPYPKTMLRMEDILPPRYIEVLKKEISVVFVMPEKWDKQKTIDHVIVHGVIVPTELFARTVRVAEELYCEYYNRLAQDTCRTICKQCGNYNTVSDAILDNCVIIQHKEDYHDWHCYNEILVRPHWIQKERKYVSTLRVPKELSDLIL